MKNKIILLIMIPVVLVVLSNCRRDIVDIANNKISGWQIDSINFIYNWISPTDVDFLSSKTGYILGSNGYLIKTNDYAKSWAQSFIEGDSLGVMTSTISFINDSTGYIYGTSNVLNGSFYGILYKTTDSGNHWTKHFYETPYNLYSMKFFDLRHGIAIDWRGTGTFVMTTADGGSSWQTADLQLDPSFRGIFYMGNSCYTTGTNQRIFKSYDYGYTWSTIDVPKTSSHVLSGFYFIDDKNGFVDCSDKKFETTDGGNSWQEIHLPFKSFFTPFSPWEYFHFANNSEGITMADSMAYTGGDFPSFLGTYVYTTSNGGKDWARSGFLRNFSFGAIEFISPDFAYCISINNIYTLKKE
jgi:photosystem II stability/assembly factor-like uncharacterized protein